MGRAGRCREPAGPAFPSRERGDWMKDVDTRIETIRELVAHNGLDVGDLVTGKVRPYPDLGVCCLNCKFDYILKATRRASPACTGCVADHHARFEEVFTDDPVYVAGCTVPAPRDAFLKFLEENGNAMRDALDKAKPILARKNAMPSGRLPLEGTPMGF